METLFYLLVAELMRALPHSLHFHVCSSSKHLLTFELAPDNSLQALCFWRLETFNWTSLGKEKKKRDAFSSFVNFV